MLPDRLPRAGVDLPPLSARAGIAERVELRVRRPELFGLLFLKRLSDRFEEECDALRGVAGANVEDPDEHDFFVPKAARWSEIQKAATNIGEVLNKAAAKLEDTNARTLEGVLAGIDFNDERRLGDNRNRDNVLARLVQHFRS